MEFTFTSNSDRWLTIYALRLINRKILQDAKSVKDYPNAQEGMREKAESALRIAAEIEKDATAELRDQIDAVLQPGRNLPW